MQTQITPAQLSLIADLAADFRPLVAKIESSIATTQNHYGRYGALLSSLSKGDKTVAGVIFLALQAAGANAQGLRDAFKNFV